MRAAKGFISLFTRHKVAANLLMIIMILVGAFSLSRLNVQFLPSFQIDVVSVTIVWRGATAEDVENSILNPLEKEFKSLDHVDKMLGVAKTGAGTINIEFEEGTDMGRALEDVRELVAQVRNLPTASEEPVIKRITPYEDVAQLIITSSNNDIEALRPTIRRFEKQLLERGIPKISILGLPEQEISIQIPTKKLVELKQSLPAIALRIAARSIDLPAGMIGRRETGQQLRSLNQRRSIREFEELPIISDNQGQLLKLKDIASIKLRAQDNQTKVVFQGRPAVEMTVLRTENANAFKMASIFHHWLEQTRPQLGKSIQLHVYNESWTYIKGRINLLLKNGLTGLILIILILFLFLHKRVALWVVAGIPASFMLAMGVLYVVGGSINMVSLFAFIMTLGIIVDDTIVIGEQALTNIKSGSKLLDSIEGATLRMLAPIMSSSLTTICAFLPLFLISGIIGTILFAIPLVVTCVILASIVECFLVLPGHLYQSFKQHTEEHEPPYRQKINAAFEHFKTKKFRALVTFSLRNRAATLLSAIGLFVIALGLLIGGYVRFSFFPSPEGQLVNVSIQFAVGTPEKKLKKFITSLNTALDETNKALSPKGKPIAQTSVAYLNYNRINKYRTEQGEHIASMTIELMSPDLRNIDNADFIKQWRSRIILPAGIDNFSITQRRSGPPGEDIDIQMSGANTAQLKKASLDLQSSLQSIKGVSSVKDDLPFGQQQLIYELNATGKSLNLTTQQVGQQLRAAFNGQIAQIFNLPDEEIEVRVMLPDKERYQLGTLEHYPIITANGEAVPLGTVVKLNYRQGPDVLLHTDTKLTVHVTAKVNNKINNTNVILNQLEKNTFKSLEKKYNVELTLRGKAEEQQDTLNDMKYGLLLGLSLIYIILAWVFSSYTWPLVVMAVIPLGLTGAIFGHLLMRMDLTILSLFGFFGLSGIVINDSIILVNEYRHLMHTGMYYKQAIIEASCKRLRAVLLTSVTTVAGLLPLLFERSLQAQFLIPMATSITFGLAYATLLILVVVPTLLSLFEGARYRHEKTKQAKNELLE